MTTISADQIGLRDAADVFGVSIDTLRRRIRDNQMDEALLVQGPFGATWVLPRAQLDAIASREGWSVELGVTESPVESVPSDGVASTTVPSEAAGLEAALLANPGGRDHISSSGGEMQGEKPSSAQGYGGVGEPATQRPTPAETLIDLREGPASGHEQQPAGDVITEAPPLPQLMRTAEDEAALVQQIQAAIAGEVRTALSENVEAELTRVREAITNAEVRAVAAEARTDAMRSEQGRLAAQLKRAEADAEYWRSQHDRLDRELDRERTARVGAEKARAVAETRSGELTRTGEVLRADLAASREREREVARADAETQAQLDQARMAMGWWSRRRLQRLGQRHDGGGGES